jgi:hypothetical protein
MTGRFRLVGAKGHESATLTRRPASRSLAKALRKARLAGLLQPHVEPGMLLRNIGCRLGAPGWHSQLGLNQFMSPDSKPAPVCATLFQK